ncbi:hypothetical protein BpHYR1_034433 [Brachionus plicatilis]|uniref:Uncharacterized protein n=1 Tax=Brachionus plicatilis TaxID=10195 RepID=A0A3M7TAD7_BRAPC|nr:hypothetical protein BpHYR1_034433 [Brachionus plicatilis]
MKKNILQQDYYECFAAINETIAFSVHNATKSFMNIVVKKSDFCHMNFLPFQSGLKKKSEFGLDLLNNY